MAWQPGAAVRMAATVFKKEPILWITLLATAALSFVSVPRPSAIHWDVIAILFGLMLVCGAFEQCGLLGWAAGWALGAFRTPRKLGLAMIAVTGALSMVVTNDVALLTVVPLTLIMAQVSDRDPSVLVVLETLSANLFSAMTPFGNPQNLYLYAFYGIPAGDFFSAMIPFGLLGAALLAGANFLLSRGGPFPSAGNRPPLRDGRLLAGACVAFGLNLLSVLRVVDYPIALAATLLIFLVLAPRRLLRVDYGLLATFVLFFLFTDSMTAIPQVQQFFEKLLVSPRAVLFLSAGLSQVISNVPAAVLVSGFTGEARALLYGVSAGGLGTLVASLASLISYRLYSRQYPAGPYFKWFTFINFTLLALLLGSLVLFL